MSNIYRNGGARKLLPRSIRMVLAIVPWLCLSVALSLTGCADNAPSEGSWQAPFGAPVPAFGAAVFTTPTTINNTYFPLVPGTTTLSRTQAEDGLETGVFEVTATTRVLAGVTCRQVHDRVYLDDLLIEDTLDWFAQDNAGNVWYFGEAVTNYEYDENDVLLGTNTNGSWEAGADIAATGTNANRRKYAGFSKERFIRGSFLS